TPIYFSFGSAKICSRLRTVLLVRTISASAACLTTSRAGERSWIWHSPSDLSSSQAKSPGFKVKPSRTTILIIVLGGLRLYAREDWRRYRTESYGKSPSPAIGLGRSGFIELASDLRSAAIQGASP